MTTDEFPVDWASQKGLGNAGSVIWRTQSAPARSAVTSEPIPCGAWWRVTKYHELRDSRSARNTLTMPTKRLVQVSSAYQPPVKPRGPDRPPVEGPGQCDFVCPVCGRVLGKWLPEQYDSTVVLECWCGTYSTFPKP